MTVFASLLEDRPVEVGDAARGTRSGRRRCRRSPSTTLSISGRKRDQVGCGVEDDVVGDPVGDLGSDGVVVERRGGPVGELVGVKKATLPA